ncbi:MAG: MBL fold metallo-hydrolase [Promethearchaeota archaeon]|nr:MAG: MBL fold metallo-hydrolase [Candidatus Lokiarchaeota archaeon]
MVEKRKLYAILGIVFGVLIIGTGVFVPVFLFTGIKVTLLNSSGVMIEAKGTRIYIDPSFIPGQYKAKPADVVCVTHEHNDHYLTPCVDYVQQEGTINIFPETMPAAITLFDGIGVSPGDEIVINDKITVTAFYMYTEASLHSQANNWTSYLIDIDGFVIFHAGDSGNITEFQQLEGLVDLAMFPLVPAFVMTYHEVVDAINKIQPQTVILYHDDLEAYTAFYEACGDLFEAHFLLMDHFTSTRFR